MENRAPRIAGRDFTFPKFFRFFPKSALPVFFSIIAITFTHCAHLTIFILIAKKRVNQENFSPHNGLCMGEKAIVPPPRPLDTCITRVPVLKDYMYLSLGYLPLLQGP